MSLTLWGRASSVNVQKALWGLAEFDLAFGHEVVGGKFGRNDAPEFAALTPTRKVPVLQDGALGIWESHAILRHLARIRPDHPLGQAMADPGRAGRIDPWMEFGTATLQPPFITMFWQRVRMTAEQRDPQADAQGLKGVAAALAVIEAALSDGRDHLAGSAFSLADIAVGTPMHRIFDVAPELAGDVPKVISWRDRLAEREGYRTHVAVDYEELRVR